MKRIITAGSALAAVLALGVLCGASAQAHLFLWSGAVGSLVLVRNQGRLIFTPATGGAAVECTAMKLDGKIASKSALTGALVGEFTSCTGFGFPMTISPVEFEYSADEAVKVLNTIVITVPLGACSVKVSPAGNEALKKLRYLRDFANSNALLGHAEISGITSFASGGPCGSGTSKTGAFVALGLASVDATGTLSWV